MTISEIKVLVDRLTSRLAGRPAGADDLDLATDYAAACADVNKRLLQCSRMIEEGSSLQALLFAEEKPGLMDMLGVLGFGKQRDWIEFCEEHSLPLPVLPDKEAVKMIDGLYAAGSRASQAKALYHDFRGAMAAKDEMRAFEVVCAISRLDPSDQDAAREVVRLERLVKESARRGLEAALAGGDENTTIRWLNQCEALEVDAPDLLSRGRGLKAVISAREAASQARALIEELPSLERAGLWQQCGERAARIRSLIAANGITLDPAGMVAVNRAMQFFESQRIEASTKARFDGALNALTSGVAFLQGKRFSAKRALAELEADLLSLRKLYEAVKAFGISIPETLTQEVGQLASSLESESARRRKMRRLGRCAALGCATLVVAGTGWILYQLYQASSFVSEIQRMQERGASVALRQTVANIRSSHGALLQLPKLSTAVLDAEQWLGGVDKKRAAAEVAVTQAAKAADSNFEDLTPEQAIAMFRQVSADLDALPPDAADSLKIEFAKSDKKLQLWIPEQRNERTVRLRKALTDVRPMVAELSPAKPPEELEERLQEIAPYMESIQGVLDDQAPDVSVPAALRTEAEAAVLSVKSMQELLQRRREALEALSRANALGEFSAALQTLAGVGLPGAEDVKAAQKAALKQMDEKILLGQLILPSAPEALAAIKSVSELANLPFPETPREAETDRLAQLINDENIADVYEAMVVPPSAVSQSNFKSGRKIYSRGPIKEQERDPVSVSSRAWSGMIYDPSKSPSSVLFADAVFTYRTSPTTGEQSGEYVAGATRTEASESLRRLKLGDLVNADGSKYRQSILSILDRVREAKNCPPLVQAYVLQELIAIAQMRPAAWGLVWTPALEKDASSFRAISAGALKSGDWMLPVKAPLNAKLKDAVENGVSINYQIQAKLHRRLAAEVLEGGIEYRGFVDSTGKPVLLKAADSGSPTKLWGFPEEGEGLASLFTSGESIDHQPSSKPLPLTPLFAIGGTDRANVDGVMRDLGIAEGENEVYSAQLPPLFREEIPSRE